MTVKFEVKGALARLLATEDLVVEHKNETTASFNVDTRVLTLPMWEKASDSVYTMLVLHEISHALWTPNIDWTKEYDIPPSYVNIVEDVRVEKLCKRKYPGSPKSFYSGYKELSEQDFFKLGDDDVNKYGFADRVNLYFKIGSYVCLSFTPREKEIINLIYSCETFDDTLKASEVLFKYCSEEENNLSLIDIDVRVEGNSSGPSNGKEITVSLDSSNVIGGSSSSESSNNTQSDQTQCDNKNTEKNIDINSQEGGDVSNHIVKTLENLDESIKNLVNLESFENVYVEIPELDLTQIVIPNNKIHNSCKDIWSKLDTKLFVSPDNKYTEFKKSSQKEVNYLIKEFESRKSADSYSRSHVAKTGVLDCSKIHTYKFNEDLFKKITIVPEGKNHGLIFVLDWSGSMDVVMMDTIKQLYNLIWFCKKTSIPFEVYAFTTDYPSITYDEFGKKTYRKPSYRRKSGVFHIPEWFSMMQLFTSKVNSATLDDHMRNIFRVVYSFSHHVSYKLPIGLSLSGTPLNEALISLHQIIPKFKTENNVQKVQCVILTDGDAAPSKHHYQVVENKVRNIEVGISHINSNTFLRNRKTGNTYNFLGYFDETRIFIRNLKDSFPDTNFIGIRILMNRDINNFIRRYIETSAEHSKMLSHWKKTKTCVIKNAGYHSYFGISSSSISQEAEFEVEDDATKVQIKNAFIKSLKTKQMNKKILNEFVELIV